MLQQVCAEPEICIMSEALKYLKIFQGEPRRAHQVEDMSREVFVE